MRRNVSNGAFERLRFSGTNFELFYLFLKICPEYIFY